ncbi:MAG: SagB/ThcOx family dehydrogenase [Pseudolabrys sp.]
MPDITLTDALSQRRTVRDFTGAAISLETLNRLIWAAQGITRADGKRTAPSAHALHPLRLFVVANRVDGLNESLFAVDPADLSLKDMSRSGVAPALKQAALDDLPCMTDAACIVAICADMVTPSRAFADQKPYGTRGARYVSMEAGAAAQNLQLQATAEGLGGVWVAGFDDEAVAAALGLEAPLTPLIFLCVGQPVAKD